MRKALKAFRGEYRAAFEAYLASGEETALSAAYELGRTAMERELSVLELAEIHHEVLFGALTGPDPPDAAWAGQAASRFVLELLATYEMVQRGFVEVHQAALLQERHARRLRRLAAASVAINAAGSLEDIAAATCAHALEVIEARTAATTVRPTRTGTIVRTSGGGGEPAGRSMSAPLLRRNGSVLGDIAVVGAPGSDFTPGDEAILTQLAQLAGVALENAELYDQERLIAETLQRRLLPLRLPRVEGVEMAWRYVPALGTSAVGGDWYDAVVLPDGRIAVAVGDVMGKGIAAAAGMGQLRVAMRAYALEGHTPWKVIAQLDHVLEDLGENFATTVYLLYDPASHTLRYANAGHPPPLLVGPDGVPSFLRGGLCPPLGCIAGTPEEESAVTVPAGATLVVYTDGLVEDRGADIDEGLRRLSGLAGREPGDLEAYCDHILEGVRTEQRTDDVALLAVRFRAVDPSPPAAADERAVPN